MGIVEERRLQQLWYDRRGHWSLCQVSFSRIIRVFFHGHIFVMSMIMRMVRSKNYIAFGVKIYISRESSGILLCLGSVTCLGKELLEWVLLTPCVLSECLLNRRSDEETDLPLSSIYFCGSSRIWIQALCALGKCSSIELQPQFLNIAFEEKEWNWLFP